MAIGLLTLFNNTKFHFYCSRELSIFWLNKLYGSIKKILNINKNQFLNIFVFWIFSQGEGLTNFCLSFIKILIFLFVELSHLSSFITFSFSGTNLHHGQGNWSFSKISN